MAALDEDWFRLCCGRCTPIGLCGWTGIVAGTIHYRTHIQEPTSLTRRRSLDIANDEMICMSRWKSEEYGTSTAALDYQCNYACRHVVQSKFKARARL
jgi:hypothetical protein